MPSTCGMPTASETMANKNKNKKKAEASTFDETALAQLTNKIDKTLSKSTDDGAKGKRKRQDGPANAPKAKKRQLVETAPETSQRKSGGSGKPKPGKMSKEALLEEILALGGDEDDLDLIANIDSDADEDEPKPKPKVDNEAPVGKKFKDELAKFASSLGFDQLPADEDIEDAEEDERGSGEAEWEDDEEEEEVEEEEEEEEEEVEADEADADQDMEDEAPMVEEPPPKSKKGKTVSTHTFGLVAIESPNQES
jgi:ribosome biogenesis protein MAK21